jgi:hypothetical protein
VEERFDLDRSAVDGTDIAIDNYIKLIVIIDPCSTESFLIGHDLAMALTEAAYDFIFYLVI